VAGSKRVEIGDVMEIPTPKGLAYAQYSHLNEEMGALLRVLPGFYALRPDDLQAVAAQPERYFTFFPLQAAIRQGIFEIVGHAAVPAQSRKFPVFRPIGGISNTGQALNWWLWDGRKEWFVGEHLSDEHKRLPPGIVMTDVTLVDRLTRGWTPEMDFAPSREEPEQSSQKEPEESSQTVEPIGGLRHFLYFLDEATARGVASRLERESLKVTVGPGADTSDWLVLVHQEPGSDASEVERLRSRLERIASKNSGEYDGWEMRAADASKQSG
jgi:hypothetical protein